MPQDSLDRIFFSEVYVLDLWGPLPRLWFLKTQTSSPCSDGRLLFLGLNVFPFLITFFFFFGLFAFYRAAPVAYGDSQARDLIGTVAAGLHHSHSNVCNLHHSSRQCWILNPLSGARDRTRVLMVVSRVHYR